MIVYRNLQEQVQKNKEDIEEILPKVNITGGKNITVADGKINLNNQVAVNKLSILDENNYGLEISNKPLTTNIYTTYALDIKSELYHGEPVSIHLANAVEIKGGDLILGNTRITEAQLQKLLELIQD